MYPPFLSACLLVALADRPALPPALSDLLVNLTLPIADNLTLSHSPVPVAVANPLPLIRTHKTAISDR